MSNMTLLSQDLSPRREFKIWGAAEYFCKTLLKFMMFWWNTPFYVWYSFRNYDTKKVFIRFLTYTAMFIDKFNNVPSPICKDNKHCYVMGDLNPDLLQYNHHVPTVTFKGY